MSIKNTLPTAGSACRKGSILAAAFFIPAAFLFLVCAVSGRYPFGSMSILDMDLPSQYIHFFSYLKSVAAGENDLFYTFSKVLGGDMTGLTAYYLLSPFNLAFLFVPESSYPLLCTVIASIKMGLCGLTMALLLSGRERDDGAVLIFSAAYGLMAYNVVYFSNIMWLDAVYTLPVMVMGIVRLTEGRSGLLYTLSLAFALLSNYYTGYMLCIFSVFFFAFGCSLRLAEKRRGLGRLVIRYALYSLFAGALAAVVLIPTFLSLEGTKAGLDTSNLAIYRLFPLESFAIRLFSNSVINDLLLQNLPWLYTGLVTNMLLALYMFNGRIKLSERLISLVFLFALLMSFNVNGLYVIWHGFNYPACFPFRNAFVLSFMMIYLAWRCYREREGLSLRSFSAAAAVTGAVVFASKPFSNPDLSALSLAADLVISGFVLAVLAVERWKGCRRLSFAALVLVQLLSLGGNAAYLKNNYTAGSSLDAYEYKESFERAEKDILSIKSYDDSFYRVSCDADSINEPMQLAYNSLSHFSSTDKTAVKELMRGFGYRFCHNMWTAYGRGCTAAADALFSVKYLRGELNDIKAYPLLPDIGSGVPIAENPNALGIGFLADTAVLDTSFETKDVFRRQEQAFSDILGRPAGIFYPASELEMELYNYTEPEPYKDGGIYTRADMEHPAGFVYSFTARSSDPIYIYTYAPLLDYYDPRLCAQLYVNGEHFGEYMGSYSWETICLGSFEKGERVEFEIRPDREFFILGETFVYHEDREALALCAGEIRARDSGAGLEKLSSSHIRWEGRVDEEDLLLMLTVPAERGWSVTVDGRAAEIESVFGSLMAIELDVGEHSVELEYRPAGLAAGLAMSAVSLVLLILWELCQRRRRMKHAKSQSLK